MKVKLHGHYSPDVSSINFVILDRNILKDENKMLSNRKPGIVAFLIHDREQMLWWILTKSARALILRKKYAIDITSGILINAYNIKQITYWLNAHILVSRKELLVCVNNASPVMNIHVMLQHTCLDIKLENVS